MSIETIGIARWDFVDAAGQQTTLPPADAGAPAIRFPARWRVFGPLDAKAVVDGPARTVAADPAAAGVIAGLSALPDQLTIAGQTLGGRDVELDGDTLDIDALFLHSVGLEDHVRAARQGRQIYAFAQLVLEKEAEVPFGAGADFWMQWWIDGRPVFDTLAGGNCAWPPSRTDQRFRCRLSAGRHLLAVRLISGQASGVLRAGVLDPREELLASITVSDRWQFLPDLHEIRPPVRPGKAGHSALDWGHTMAIAVDRPLADETVECDFQMHIEANFGIIIGAQDSGHYYTLQIPRWGQLWRARTFWACLCKADGSGYLRILKMALVPYVPCHWNSWIHLKVERRGNCIRTWIDGVKGPSVIDDTCGPGYAGLTGFCSYTVRNLRIAGTAVEGPKWETGDRRGQPWFRPVPDADPDLVQNVCELLRLSDDEILMVVQHGPSPRWMLSRDQGRTWAPHRPGHRAPIDATIMPWGLRWFSPRPGVVRAFQLGSVLTGGSDRPPLPGGAALAWRQSTDKGLTWTDPTPCTLLGDWSRDIFRTGFWNHVYGGTRLRDGTLLMMVLHGMGLDKLVPHWGQGTWGTGFAQPYVSRSEDDGQTWSEPVPMDNAALNDGTRPDSPHAGFSETAFAQLPSGRIVAHCRPFAAPFMWRTHSDDGGRTWRVVTYEPFSGAGGPQLLCTRSGYLVSVKRGPALCMHISTDGGVNWDEGTILDYPASFNGLILEVEPDVVLVVYPESMGESRPSHVRAQRIRITPQGPRPEPP